MSPFLTLFFALDDSLSFFYYNDSTSKFSQILVLGYNEKQILKFEEKKNLNEFVFI